MNWADVDEAIDFLRKDNNLVLIITTP